MAWESRCSSCLYKKRLKMKTTWNDLSIKEKLAIGSACVAFALGWLITGLAAFVPLLISEQGVLWILGQSLVYTASVFGVSAYFRSEAVQLRRDMDRHLERMEHMQIQREKLRQGLDVEEIPNEDEE
jgi:hypothetical protein